MDAAQEEQDLHTGVTSNLNQLGHNETVASVNPDDRSALNKVKEVAGEAGEDAVHVIGSTFEELTSGTGGTTHTRGLKNKIPLAISALREKLRLQKKAA